ncbi:ribosome maturation factor RimM [Hydrogenophaga crassostreae]|uniref:Ribosome maturation factor RimM n=1 Tax=Hydrogenophaga crassostreae TaxID=1763535 RepID=A0A167GWF8_9BURK|nr:ribosome maturation factor RimM [Hydrogenophaga crassostreae]AOW12769.1 ribosome maturation factor RimM [Hydrogenophaga crassostreae]OAD39958.1 ribosome maturation factor RimM [Hydrogenophaga crassostreae]
MTSGYFKASSMPDDAIELGRIQEAFGIKGWVRIHPHSADTEALFAATEWHLQPPEPKFARGFSAFTGVVSVKVGEIKAHADGIVARIDGLDDRTGAEGLKGVRISVPRSAFPVTPEGEFYWVDLIGLRVVNREGVEMGVVRDLMPTGPNSVLVLEYTDINADGKEQLSERMIPFVDAYVDKVDQAARLITVDWGLDY